MHRLGQPLSADQESGVKTRVFDHLILFSMVFQVYHFFSGNVMFDGIILDTKSNLFPVHPIQAYDSP